MKNKNLLIILGVVVVIFLAQTKDVKKEAEADVSNADITRSFSATEVKAGNTFDVTYTASGFGAGSWGVLIEDNTGSASCIHGADQVISAGFLGPATTYTTEIVNADSVGTCVFTGTFIFAGDTDKPILVEVTDIVTVCDDVCAAPDTGCRDGDTRWYCETGGVCNVEVDEDCEVYEDCVAGLCEPNCSSLESGAFDAIIAWAGDPTAPNKTAALGAILLWAANC